MDKSLIEKAKDFVTISKDEDKAGQYAQIAIAELLVEQNKHLKRIADAMWTKLGREEKDRDVGRWG